MEFPPQPYVKTVTNEMELDKITAGIQHKSITGRVLRSAETKISSSKCVTALLGGRDCIGTLLPCRASSLVFFADTFRSFDPY